MYTIEYAPSSRSTCKVCHLKMPKGDLRIGKMVDSHVHGMFLAWHHFQCFWSPGYMRMPGEKMKGWGNFKGTHKLEIADQNMLHLKATGRPLDQAQIDSAELRLEEFKQSVEEQNEVAKNAAEMRKREKKEMDEEVDAAFAVCNPRELALASIEQYLEEMTVPDIKATLKENNIDYRGRTKKADLVAAIRGQSMEKISSLAYSSLNKKLVVSELKSVLKGSNINCSGTKKDLIQRLLESAGCPPSHVPGQSSSSNPEPALSTKELGPDIDLVHEEWPLLQPFSTVRSAADVKRMVDNKLIPRHLKWDSSYSVVTSELSQVLAVCGLELIVLELGDSGTGSGVDSSAAEVIAKNCPRLQKLSLESCRFNDQEAIMLGHGCPRLRYLKISGHDKCPGNLKDRFLVKLREDRSYLKKLKVLDVIDQSCDFGKMEKLSKARKSLTIKEGESEGDGWFAKRGKTFVMKGGKMVFGK